MGAPAATPCPGSGVTTTEPMSPSTDGLTQSGTAAGSIQRDGTGGNPRRASASPGTEAGSATALSRTTRPSGPQKLTVHRRPEGGVTTTAASARCCAASRAVTSMHRPAFREARSSVDAWARNPVRSRSARRASSADRRAVSSTSHHTTSPFSARLGRASKLRSPTGPRAGSPSSDRRGSVKR